MIIHEEDIGRLVLCDFCDEDFTNRDDIGGILFQGSAICPSCEPRLRVFIKKHNEQKFITAHCPELQSFADWVRDLRGENTKIIISTL